MLIQKIKNALFDRRNLFLFYTLGLLYAMTVLQIVRPVYFDNPYSAYNRYFMKICYIWTLLIIIRDIVKHQVEKTSAQLALLVFLAFACCSVILGGGKIGISDLYTLTGFFMKQYVFFSMVEHCTKEQADHLFLNVSKQIVYVVLAVNALSLIIYVMYRANITPAFGLFQDYTRFITFVPHSGVSEARFQGLYIYPQIAGFMCYLAMALTAYLYQKRRMSLWLASLSGLLALIMTAIVDSRTSMICEALIILYSLWPVVRKKFSRKQSVVLMLVLVLIGCFAVFLYKAPEIRSLMAQYGGQKMAINALSSNRFVMWKNAIQDGMKRPLLGIGWGRGDLYSIIGSNNGHDIFINLFYYGGLLGLLSYCAFLIIGMKKIHQNWKFIREDNNDWLVITSICLFVQSVLEIALLIEDAQIQTPLFYALMGYLICYRSVGKYTDQEKYAKIQ